MANVLCIGCDRPVWEAHRTIAEHIACEAAQQAEVRRQQDAYFDSIPERDGRFTSRNAPIRKRQKPQAKRVTCTLCDGTGDSGDWRALNCERCGGSGKELR